MLTIDVFKTGARVTVELPPSLLELIDRTETGDLHFIISQTGKPFTVESFGNWFRDRCREAGVEKSAHGLRKLSATIAAEGGAGAVALMAQYGWTNIQEAERYTRSADYPRLPGPPYPAGMKQTNTMAELADMRIDVIAWCYQCRGNRRFDAGDLAGVYGPSLTVRRLALRLRCMKCGARDCGVLLSPRGRYGTLETLADYRSKYDVSLGQGHHS